MKEIWKDIVGYEGLYQISNYGNIVSIKNRWGKRGKPRNVSKHITKKGYERVALYKEKTQKHFMVHRLVMMAFNPMNGENLEINHKNYIRSDNRLENLEWLTHKDNVRYSKAKKINQYDLQSNFIKTWDCIRDVEKELKIDHRQICDCLKGKQKTCHGYIWKYKEGEL